MIGPDKLSRPKKETQKNKTLRKNAEDLLLSNDIEKRITWRQFLSKVSHTTDSLADNLQKVFKDNNYELLDDHEIYYDSDDNGEDCCIKCQLRLFEKVAMTCGHTNVCQNCVNKLKEDFSRPACPNITCGKEILNTMSLQ